MDSAAKARKLIAPYLGQQVTAKLDGVMFDDQPNLFRFRFVDPGELRAELFERFTDEMGMEPWDQAAPVAAISVPERSADEFAWLFLRWNDDDAEPELLVATHDNWAGTLDGGRFESLGLQIA